MELLTLAHNAIGKLLFPLGKKPQPVFAHSALSQ